MSQDERIEKLLKLQDYLQDHGARPIMALASSAFRELSEMRQDLERGNSDGFTERLAAIYKKFNDIKNLAQTIIAGA